MKILRSDERALLTAAAKAEETAGYLLRITGRAGCETPNQRRQRRRRCRAAGACRLNGRASMTMPSHPHTPAIGHIHIRTCPQAVEQLVDHLEREMVDIPHIMLTDVDISTGGLILWLDNGKRFVVTIAESAERAD